MRPAVEGGSAADQEQVKTLVDHVRDMLDQLLDRVDQTISEMTIPLRFAAVQARAQIVTTVDAARELVDAVHERLSPSGSPAALQEAGEAWHQLVGEPCHALSSDTLRLSRLATDDRWAGDGADAYNAGVGGQGGALDEVPIMVKGIAAALRSISGGITGYWREILGCMLALLGGIVAAIVAAASGPGVIVAMVPLGLAVGGAALRIWVAGKGLETTMELAAESLGDAVRYLDPWPEMAL